MRIKKQYKRGDIRIIKKFLLFPKTLDGETRWLETAKIEQRFIFYYDFVIPMEHWSEYGWAD